MAFDPLLYCSLCFGRLHASTLHDPTPATGAGSLRRLICDNNLACDDRRLTRLRSTNSIGKKREKRAE